METKDAHSPTPNMEGWESEYLAIDRSQQEQFLSTERGWWDSPNAPRLKFNEFIELIEFLKLEFSLFSFNTTPRLIAPGLCSYIASCCGGAAQQKIFDHSTIPSTDSWEILKPRLRFSQFHA